MLRTASFETLFLEESGNYHATSDLRRDFLIIETAILCPI